MTLPTLIGSEVFLGRPIVTERIPPRRNGGARRDAGPYTADLRHAVHPLGSLPALFPSAKSLAHVGVARHFQIPQIALPTTGISLGEASSSQMRQEVRIAPDDRTRHCYVLGATGSGKSSLLYNMILQDLAGDAGVGLIDPHGDLYRQVLDAVPRKRSRNVIVVDPSDFDHAVAVNFLECKGPHERLQRNFVIGELARIFYQLYGSVPESMGPAFLLYMRNTVALLMDDPDRTATLADVPRVFEDREYRRHLLRHCTDPLVEGFWRNIAHEATGDWSVANYAPYITNKFTEFVYNPLVRPIIGQPRSTIDFRDAMDRGHVVLVNLAKGLLGERDARFLGMLMMGKLFLAAMGRSSVARQYRRTPFYLFLDEFQSVTTASVAGLLAEARKFGLSLTLAHQNLSQLDNETRQSVLGNVGTKLFFRIGTPDAPFVEPYTQPTLSAGDLISMPDRHVVARLLANSVPTPPFVFRTADSIPQTSSPRKDRSTAEDICAHSRARHTRPVADVERDIAARRTAYRASLDYMLAEAKLPHSTLLELSNAGVQTVTDLRIKGPKWAISSLSDKEQGEALAAYLNRTTSR